MAFALVTKTKWAGPDPGTSSAINTTGADLLVLVTSRFTGSAMNPSDSKGCTWHSLTDRFSGSNCRSHMYYATKADGGFTVGASHTFTFSSSATWYGSAELLAFSGSDFSADPLDQQNDAVTSGATSLAAGSVTPTSNGQLIVTGVSTVGATHTISSGITSVEDAYDYLALNYMGGGAAWKEHTSGAINPQWGWTGTTDAAATIATFRATSVGSNLSRVVTAEGNRLSDLSPQRALVTATGSIKPTVYVEAELAGVGAGWTSLTSDVLRNYEIDIRYGIQGSGPADLVASTGTARFALNNSARNSASTLGYYSVYHASKRTGWMLGINCRIRMADPNTAAVWTCFIGRIDAIDPTPGIHAERAVVVTVTDWIDEAARWTLTPAIGEQIGKSWDQILTAILAEMPRQPTATAIDAGVETYSYALDTSSNTRQPALSEFVKLAASEFGAIYVNGEGTFTAQGRHARLLDTVSDWTITESDLQALRLPSTRDEVINTVRVQQHPKKVDDLPTTLIYDQTNVIEIGAGATKFLLGSFRDPVTGDPIGATEVQNQSSGVDYMANDKEDGTGTDVTANLTIVTTIGASGVQQNITNAGSATAFLTRNQLYGRGIYDRGTVQFEARDSGSVATLGEHVVNFDMPYQDDDDVGQGAADYILGKYSSAFAQARSIRVAAKTTTLLAQVLARDISDRLTISETVTGLSSSYFINGVELRVLTSGHVIADYTLAPAADPFAGLYWILGTSVLATGTLPAPF